MKFRAYVGAALVALAAAAPSAFAQTYPTKPVRLILPFPPGGPSDILGRALSQKLSEQMGQQVIADNRPGAGGNLGLELTAKAAPDGYVMVLSSPLISLSPSLYTKLNYDPQKDLAPISLVAQIQNVVLVHPSVPAKNLKELVQVARASPGKLNYGSGGVGTTTHLAPELFMSMTKTQMVHVPFKGSGQSVISQLAGEIAANFPSVPTAIPYIKVNRLRGLGVTTVKRTQALPAVPSIAEAGVPGYEATQWFGVLAPAGTPRSIIDRMHQEVVRALRSADVKERVTAEGMDIVASTPEEFAGYIKSETDKWAKVIKAAGIKPQ